MRIDAKNASVALEFSLGAYSFEAISSSAQDFLETCDCGVEKSADGKKARVTLSPKVQGICLEELGFEFCNFVIGKTREAGTQ